MTIAKPCRVMVVDDSAVIRGLLTKLLESDGGIAVVASAQNGEVALKALERHEIDVVILDIEMPVMDGLTALPLMIKARPDLKVIMASTLTRKNADISMRALRAGATDYIPKPTSASELHSTDDFKRELIGKIKALVPARGGATAPPRDRAATPVRPAAAPSSIQLRRQGLAQPEAIGIASSTGGPQALFEVFGNLPAGLTQPVFVTQHMPPTFTAMLAEHISRVSELPCHEAVDGEAVVGGQVYLAPGGFHMEVVAKGGAKTIALHQPPPENFCRPAADPLFRSMAQVYGGRLLAVVLTGMGADGKKGAEEITAAGGTVIAQDEASSVVWGMPGAVATAGLCSALLPLSEIAGYVARAAMRTAA